MARHLRIAALAALPAASACSILGPVLGPTQQAGTVYSATRLTAAADDAPINLPDLICSVASESPPNAAATSSAQHQTCQTAVKNLQSSDDLPKGPTGIQKNISILTGTPQIPTPNNEYDQAINASMVYFNASVPVADQPKRRNEIQEALIGKSNYLCSDYKANMMRIGTSNNLIMGDVTTALAGLATIFTQVGTVRPLAGAATIASGLRNEFNSDVFAELNLQVITAGIDKRRSDWYATLLKARGCSIDQYPLQQAIKDAYVLHNYCNLYSGLEEANLSIKQAQSPGLDELTDSYQKLAKLMVATNQVYKQTKLQASTGFPSSTADTTTQNFGIQSTSSGSGQCQIPVPGMPKAAQPPAATTMTVDTGVGPITLPFTALSSTLAAQFTAQQHISTAGAAIISGIQNLEKTAKKAPSISSAALTTEQNKLLAELTTVVGQVEPSALDGSAQTALAQLIANTDPKATQKLEATLIGAKLAIDSAITQILAVSQKFDSDTLFVQAQALLSAPPAAS